MREPRSKQPKQEAYESRVWQLKDSLFWLTSKLLALAWKMFGNIPCSAATSQSLELCFAPAQGDHLLLAALGLRQMATHMQIARRRTARPLRRWRGRRYAKQARKPSLASGTCTTTHRPADPSVTPQLQPDDPCPRHVA